MAKFGNLVLTKQGIQMIALSQGSGDALTFGSINLGDGQMASGDDATTYTDLKHPCLSIPIHSCLTTTSGQVDLEAIIDNSTVSTGFFSRELGIYAKVGQGGAYKLYAYAYAGNNCDYVPDKSNPLTEDKIDVSLMIGQVSNVTAIISSSIVYVTLKEFHAHEADANAHPEAINKHNIDPSAHDAIFNKIRAMINEAKLAAHPVGSYYISDLATHPGTLFGGIWQEVNGKFLWARSDNRPAGSQGGEEYHTLNVNEIPTHTHEFPGDDQLADAFGIPKNSVVNNWDWESGHGDYSNAWYSTRPTGGGQAHNNMPPYKSVYMWVRTA